MGNLQSVVNEVHANSAPMLQQLGEHSIQQLRKSKPGEQDDLCLQGPHSRIVLDENALKNDFLPTMKYAGKVNDNVKPLLERCAMPVDVTALSSIRSDIAKGIMRQYDTPTQEYLAFHFGLHARATAIQKLRSTAIIVALIEKAIAPYLPESMKNEKSLAREQTKIDVPLSYYLKQPAKQHYRELVPQKTTQMKCYIYNTYVSLCRHYATLTGTGIISFEILAFQTLFKNMSVYGQAIRLFHDKDLISRHLHVYDQEELHKQMDAIFCNVAINEFSGQSKILIRNLINTSNHVIADTIEAAMEDEDSPPIPPPTQQHERVPALGPSRRKSKRKKKMIKPLDPSKLPSGSIDEEVVSPSTFMETTDDGRDDTSVSNIDIPDNPKHTKRRRETRRSSRSGNCHDVGDLDEEDDTEQNDSQSDVLFASGFDTRKLLADDRYQQFTVYSTVQQKLANERRKNERHLQSRRELKQKLLRQQQIKSARAAKAAKAANAAKDRAAIGKQTSTEQVPTGQNPTLSSIDIPYTDFLLHHPDGLQSNRPAMAAWKEINGTGPVMLYETWKTLDTDEHCEGPKDTEFRKEYLGEGTEYKMESFTISHVQRQGVYAFKDQDVQHGGALLKEVEHIVYSKERLKGTYLHLGEDVTSHLPSHKGQHQPFVYLAEGDKRFAEIFDGLEKELDIIGIVQMFLDMDEESICPGGDCESRDGLVKNKVRMQKNTGRGVNQFHIGFGNARTTKGTGPSQIEHEGTLLPLPNMIHDKEDGTYKKFGPVAKRVYRFMREYCSSEDGLPVMNDQNVNDVVKPFNEKMDAEECAFMAATASWQQVGKMVNLPDGSEKIDFGEEHDDNTGQTTFNLWEKLFRHTDGKNSRKKGYNFSGVYWMLIVVNGIVYRLTFIFYSRSSITDWIDKEFGYAKTIASKVLEVLKKKNGGKLYDEWCLQHDMSSVKVVAEQQKNGKITRYRLAEVDDDGEIIDEGPVIDLQWLEMNVLDCESLKYIPLPEFICRSGFASSFASIINRLTDKYSLGRRRRLELAYIALLSRSQVLFMAVLQAWLDGTNNFDWHDEKADLFLAYENAVASGKYKNHDGTPFTVRGGPCPRFGSVDHEKTWPSMVFRDESGKTNQSELEAELSKLEKDIQRLEKGDSLEYGVKGLGDVSNISFAAIMVFTGLAEHTNKAINTLQNPSFNQRGPYYKGPHSFTESDNYGLSQCAKDKLKDKKRFQRMMHYLAVYLGVAVADIENVFCIICRGQGRIDVYFYGQDLFGIVKGSVVIKTFGSTDYQNFGAVRERQKQQYNAPDLPSHPLPNYNL